jgi:hypothetical protein
VGQEVEVAVLSIDPKSRRIALGVATGPTGEEAADAASARDAAGGGFGALGDFLSRERKRKR